MAGKNSVATARTGVVLVLLMAAIQLVYALYAYIEPTAFSVARGTRLFDLGDVDWIRIYASRTLFIALFIGYLLYRKQFGVLAVASLLGIVMPATDALLAYEAGAGNKVIFKHVATALFLAITFVVLRLASRQTAGTRTLD